MSEVTYQISQQHGLCNPDEAQIEVLIASWSLPNCGQQFILAHLVKHSSNKARKLTMLQLTQNIFTMAFNKLGTYFFLESSGRLAFFFRARCSSSFQFFASLLPRTLEASSGLTWYKSLSSKSRFAPFANKSFSHLKYGVYDFCFASTYGLCRECMKTFGEAALKLTRKRTSIWY